MKHKNIRYSGKSQLINYKGLILTFVQYTEMIRQEQNQK